MSIQCLKCGYSITEPICASCVIKEVKFWVHEQKIKRSIFNKINKQLDVLLNNVRSMDYVFLPALDPWKSSLMQCISCSEEMRLRCFYCVTVQASQIVKKNLADKNAIENFDHSFNMNYYHYDLNKK